MDERMKTHGDIGWCDLASDDVARARDFYTEVIGWHSETVDVGQGPYTVFQLDGRPVAGLMARAPEGPATGAPSAWKPYVSVDDVDACSARAAAAGGDVLTGPTDIPAVGRMATIRDPTGGVIAIIEYADSEAGRGR